MDTRVIDGVALARRLREAIRERAAELAKRGRTPGLVAIRVGDDPASKVYVSTKMRVSVEVGIYSEHVELGADATEEELLRRIQALNAEPRIHGILVQLPLPKHIATDRILEAIAPEKDVDGFHPCNVGLLATGQPRFVPCTPAGVMAMLETEGIALDGREAVIIGRSNIVGKPMALLLLQKGATVTICHSRTQDLSSHTRRADIVVAAVGRPHLVGAGMVKPGAVVIDVGINRLSDGRLVGDVAFQSMLGKVACVTPVPGGVGPMTVTMLMANTVRAAELASRAA
ncbi:MAG: bifunctional methylenetetrahydrofolate dehydrogenase/methenyltetrahydrofolate cyclohydrolase FolD [Burkholderiales bacterium]|nr:bifunctional methylenetetrahydrofolate dehydrogenase/methenyltetrahydrofolate cyclohydrolase FolD [Burkholderiales bacterium]